MCSPVPDAASPQSAGCSHVYLVLCQGNPPMHQSCDPLDNFLLISIMCPIGTDLQKDGGYDKCIQPVLGCPVHGQTGVHS